PRSWPPSSTRPPGGRSTSSTTSPPWSTTGCPRWRPCSAPLPPGTVHPPPAAPPLPPPPPRRRLGCGLHDRPGRRLQRPRPPPAGLEAHLQQLARRPGRRSRGTGSPMRTGTLRRRSMTSTASRAGRTEDGMKMRTITLEEHYATPAFMDGPGRQIKEEAEAARAHPQVAAGLPRLIDQLCDIGEGRIADMDAAGLDLQ